MCGILGIYGHGDVISELYDGLLGIQHRGQDAAGVITYNGEGRLHLKKGCGLVRDVIKPKHFMRMRGHLGIGHVRYPTVGGGCAEDAQPFYVTHPFGIAMAHNGNLTNFAALKKDLLEKNQRYLTSNCDAEAILNVFADALSRQKVKAPSFENICRAVQDVFKRCRGAYSVVAVIAGHGIVVFRDPYGVKPLVFGQKTVGGKPCYAFASESVALDILGYGGSIRDVLPGEVVFIDAKRKVHAKRLVAKKQALCIFEFIYFARPDSMIDKISVYKTRLRLGEELAREWEKTGVESDSVIPVPDTARTSASSFARVLDLKYREGLVKNRYVGRTFIMAGQHERQNSIRQKLNPIKLEFRRRRVLLIDDSIVRGNTSRQIIQLARDAGARKVYYGSAAAPLRFPCVYGIDMSTKREFVAKGKTMKEISQSIGADRVLYQTVEGMVRAASAGNPKVGFCTACFTGKYPTGDVTPQILKAIENERLFKGRGKKGAKAEQTEAECRASACSVSAID